MCYVYGHLLCRKEFILVHSMGKVGSTTILETLRNYDLPAGIFQTHFLFPQDIRELCQGYPFYNIPGHLVASRIVSSFIHEKSGPIRWKVITLTRDPVLRNMAAFFQNIDRYFPGFFNRYKNGEITIESLCDYFVQHYNQKHIINNWFDRNIKSVFGIDIFERPFPKEKGYEIYYNEIDNVSLMVIKLEHLNHCHKAAFKDFLGIDGIEMKNANIGDKKEYQNIYRAFKQNINLSKDYIRDCYSAKYVQHLYDNDELEFI